MIYETVIEMAPSIALLVVVAVLVGVGAYLVMERSLTRIVIGSSLMTHGINIAILVAGGRAGGPPILGMTDPNEMSDPLPQAMILTSIVIGMSLTAFLLAVAYRSWQLNNHDEVQDDVEDRRIVSEAERDLIYSRAEDDDGSSIELDAESARDETDEGDGHHWFEKTTGLKDRQ